MANVTKRSTDVVDPEMQQELFHGENVIRMKRFPIQLLAPQIDGNLGPAAPSQAEPSNPPSAVSSTARPLSCSTMGLDSPSTQPATGQQPKQFFPPAKPKLNSPSVRPPTGTQPHRPRPLLPTPQDRRRPAPAASPREDSREKYLFLTPADAVAAPQPGDRSNLPNSAMDQGHFNTAGHAKNVHVNNFTYNLQAPVDRREARFDANFPTATTAAAMQHGHLQPNPFVFSYPQSRNLSGTRQDPYDVRAPIWAGNRYPSWRVWQEEQGRTPMSFLQELAQQQVFNIRQPISSMHQQTFQQSLPGRHPSLPQQFRRPYPRYPRQFMQSHPGHSNNARPSYDASYFPRVQAMENRQTQSRMAVGSTGLAQVQPLPTISTIHSGTEAVSQAVRMGAVPKQPSGTNIRAQSTNETASEKVISNTAALTPPRAQAPTHNMPPSRTSGDRAHSVSAQHSQTEPVSASPTITMHYYRTNPPSPPNEAGGQKLAFDRESESIFKDTSSSVQNDVIQTRLGAGNSTIEGRSAAAAAAAIANTISTQRAIERRTATAAAAAKAATTASDSNNTKMLYASDAGGRTAEAAAITTSLTIQAKNISLQSNELELQDEVNFNRDRINSTTAEIDKKQFLLKNYIRYDRNLTSAIEHNDVRNMQDGIVHDSEHDIVTRKYVEGRWINVCTVCHYQTHVLSNFRTHELTEKHITNKQVRIMERKMEQAEVSHVNPALRRAAKRQKILDFSSDIISNTIALEQDLVDVSNINEDNVEIISLAQDYAWKKLQKDKLFPKVTQRLQDPYSPIDPLPNQEESVSIPKLSLLNKSLTSSDAILDLPSSLSTKLKINSSKSLTDKRPLAKRPMSVKIKSKDITPLTAYKKAVAYVTTCFQADHKPRALRLLNQLYNNIDVPQPFIHFNQNFQDSHWIYSKFQALRKKKNTRQFLWEQFSKGNYNIVNKSESQLREVASISGAARILFSALIECKWVPTSYLTLLAVLVNQKSHSNMRNVSTHIAEGFELDILLEIGHVTQNVNKMNQDQADIDSDATLVIDEPSSPVSQTQPGHQEIEDSVAIDNHPMDPPRGHGLLQKTQVIQAKNSVPLPVAKQGVVVIPIRKQAVYQNSIPGEGSTMNLYITNLHPDVTNRTLMDLFSICGLVNYIYNPPNQDFAIVEMKFQNQALAAIKVLNGTILSSFPIKISENDVPRLTRSISSCSSNSMSFNNSQEDTLEGTWEMKKSPVTVTLISEPSLSDNQSDDNIAREEFSVKHEPVTVTLRRNKNKADVIIDEANIMAEVSINDDPNEGGTDNEDFGGFQSPLSSPEPPFHGFRDAPNLDPSYDLRSNYINVAEIRVNSVMMRLVLRYVIPPLFTKSLRLRLCTTDQTETLENGQKREIFIIGSHYPYLQVHDGTYWVANNHLHLSVRNSHPSKSVTLETDQTIPGVEVHTMAFITKFLTKQSLTSDRNPENLKAIWHRMLKSFMINEDIIDDDTVNNDGSDGNKKTKNCCNDINCEGCQPTG